MNKVGIDSPSVQSYLTILQEIISRMGSNSASAKTWCIALVSAILLVIADKGTPQLIWIAVAPILVFLLLDAYYLALERAFRDRYNEFITKLHRDTAKLEDVFIVSAPDGSRASLSAVLRAFTSFSVWPFYIVQILILVAVRYLILP